MGLWIILIILLLVFAYLFCITPEKTPEKLKRGFYAHRGLHTKDKSIPENSMLAFGRAVENGYGIELDVQLSKDGEVVVFHDYNLFRVCKQDRLVKDCTYSQLQEYSLEDTSQRIPLFTDVLKLLGGKVPLIIELKNEQSSTELEQKTYTILKNYSGDFCIESFNPLSIAWFKKHAPHIIRGQLSTAFCKEKGVNQSKPRQFVLQHLMLNFMAKPQFIAFNWLYYKNFSVFWSKKRDCILAAWTVRDEETYQLIKTDFDLFIFEYFLP